jgi:hypothetical protein
MLGSRNQKWLSNLKRLTEKTAFSPSKDREKCFFMRARNHLTKIYKSKTVRMEK